MGLSATDRAQKILIDELKCYVGLFMGFVKNKENIKLYQAYPLKLLNYSIDNPYSSKFPLGKHQK